jgi:hypothetical protein
MRRLFQTGILPASEHLTLAVNCMLSISLFVCRRVATRRGIISMKTLFRSCHAGRSQQCSRRNFTRHMTSLGLCYTLRPSKHGEFSIGAVSGSRDCARSTDYRSAWFTAHCVAHRLTTLLNCKILKYGRIIYEKIYGTHLIFNTSWQGL